MQHAPAPFLRDRWPPWLLEPVGLDDLPRWNHVEDRAQQFDIREGSIYEVMTLVNSAGKDPFVRI